MSGIQWILPAPRPSPPPFAGMSIAPHPYKHPPATFTSHVCVNVRYVVSRKHSVFFGAQTSTVIVLGSAFRQECIGPDQRLRRGKEKSRNLSRDVTMLLCHCELMFPTGVSVSPFRRGTNAAIVQTSCRHRPARGGLLLPLCYQAKMSLPPLPTQSICVTHDAFTFACILKQRLYALRHLNHSISSGYLVLQGTVA